MQKKLQPALIKQIDSWSLVKGNDFLRTALVSSFLAGDMLKRAALSLSTLHNISGMV